MCHTHTLMPSVISLCTYASTFKHSSDSSLPCAQVAAIERTTSELEELLIRARAELPDPKKLLEKIVPSINNSAAAAPAPINTGGARYTNFSQSLAGAAESLTGRAKPKSPIGEGYTIGGGAVTPTEGEAADGEAPAVVSEEIEEPPEYDAKLPKTSVRLCCCNGKMHKMVLNKEVHTVGHLRWHANRLEAPPSGKRSRLVTTNPETFYDDNSLTLKQAGLCSVQVFQRFA